jgi:intracellular multiplication protein IcmJ
MRFLPLTLSVHPSAWAVEPDEAEWEEIAHTVFERDGHTCRFCGHRCVGWQDVYHLDGEHTHWSLENLVTACPLCHGLQHLGRATVTDEQVLIWLPDVSQAALNAIVRHIHLTLYCHGEAAHAEEMPRSRDPAVHSALRAYHALAAEAKTLAARIGTSNPRELGAALLGLPEAERGSLPAALGGIRSLHRGRLYRGARDIYPEILSAWAEGASREPAA